MTFGESQETESCTGSATQNRTFVGFFFSKTQHEWVDGLNGVRKDTNDSNNVGVERT